MIHGGKRIRDRVGKSKNVGIRIPYLFGPFQAKLKWESLEGPRNSKQMTDKSSEELCRRCQYKSTLRKEIGWYSNRPHSKNNLPKVWKMKQNWDSNPEKGSFVKYKKRQEADWNIEKDPHFILISEFMLNHLKIEAWKRIELFSSLFQLWSEWDHPTNLHQMESLC